MNKLHPIICVVVALSACDPYGSYCSRVEQCARDDEDGYEDVDPDDDYHGTCVAQVRAPERVLRANEESECQVMADAYRAYYGCLASLDCDALNEEQRDPDACEDQLDDYNEAVEDADSECQGFSGCSVAPGAEPLGALVLLAVMAVMRRRRGLRPCAEHHSGW